MADENMELDERKVKILDAVIRNYVIILCILSENECTRFNQIQKAIPDISPKVLSDTLKNLETDGIIKRIVYGEVPPRVEYSLTKLGLSLMPYINNS